MKFTKDEAFKQIEGFLTDNGKKDLLLSSRSVNAALDSLMPLLADDETELSVFINRVKPMFETMYGNLKYDTSRFVKKWQQEHPEAAEGEQPKDEPTKDEGALGELLKRLENLEGEIKRRDREKSVSDKRAEIARTLAAKGVDDREWVDSLLADVAVGEDTDADAAAEKYLKLYNGVKAKTPASVTPGNAGGEANADPFAGVRKMREADAQALKGMITTN